MKLRKQAHLKEIWRNFYRKFVISVKTRKEEIRPDKVSKRSKKKNYFFDKTFF